MNKYIILLISVVSIVLALVNIGIAEEQADNSQDVLKNAFLKQKQILDNAMKDKFRDIENLFYEREKVMKKSSYERGWDNTFNSVYGQPQYGSRRARDSQDKQNRYDDQYNELKNKIEDRKKEMEDLKIKKGELELKVIEKFGGLPDWWQDKK